MFAPLRRWLPEEAAENPTKIANVGKAAGERDVLDIRVILGQQKLRALHAANGIPPDTGMYQAAKKRWGVSAQYSFSKRYAVYLSIVDLTGYVQDLRRYAPDTPDYAKSSRLQELG